MNTSKINVVSRTYDIVNGPGKDALFDACKYAYSITSRVYVNFVVAKSYTMPKDDPTAAYVQLPIKDFKIIGVGHEDGSGESLLIDGYCKAILIPNGDEYKTYKFHSYYNCRTRQGYIKLTE